MKGNFTSSVFRLALLSLILGGFTDGFAQCTILPVAVQGISYTFIQAGGSNACGVAYNPNFNVYYCEFGGNPTFPYETFSAAGAPLFQTSTGFDMRGLWWNPNTNEVEANGFATFGLWTSNLDVSGNALNTGTLIYAGQNQPDVQSCGDYDCQADEVIYYFNDSIYRYARPNGTLLGTYALTGIPVPLGNLNTSTIMYTGCAGNEIALEDAIGRQILLFNKATGAYSGASALPAAAVTNTYLNVSYANNLVWLYDMATRKWTSFAIFSGTPVGGVPVNLGNDTTVCTGQPVILDAGNPGSTYLWSEGSTTQTITVTVGGIYSVGVNAGGCFTSYDTIKVTYIGGGSPINLGNDTNVCNGGTLLLDATTAGASYLWQGGSTSATLNVTITGVYSVTVTISGCTASDTISVSLTAPIVVNLGNDTALCQSQNLLLDVSGLGTSYSWQDASANSTFNVTAPGTYSVTVTLNGCTGSDSVAVAFNSAPAVSFGNDTSLCAGQTLLLDATNAGSTYQWQDASTNATFNVTSTGTYSVTVSIGNCTASSSVNVSFAPAPSVNLGNDTSLCNGQTLTLDATNAGATYLWQDGSTSATLMVNTTGTYNVTVTLAGCSRTDSINVIAGILNPPAIIANNTSICASDSAQICAPVGFASYLWNSGDTSQCIFTQLAGNYYVTVSDNNGCSAESNHLAITVFAVQSVSVSINGDTLTAYNASNYQWYLNDSIIPGATSQTYIATQGGSYTVAVTDSNGCIAVSTPIIINGISELSFDNELSISPNPNSAGSWQLTVGKNLIGSEMQIFDDEGRLVLLSKIENRISHIELNVARGVYFLRISSPEINVSRKLIRL